MSISERIQFFNSLILSGDPVASVVNRKGIYSRTASSAVPVNAPAARSTMDDDSRTRSLRVQDVETTNIFKTI